MACYFITKYSNDVSYIEHSKIFSLGAFFIALMFVVIDFVKYLDYQFLIYYIPSLIALIYVVFKKPDYDISVIILRSSIIWLIVGYF
jgi:hypothetical protein